MKKIICAFFAFFAFMAMPAQAQVSLGIKGGLNISDMSFDKDVLKAENKAGFFVGPTLKFKVPLMGLGFDIAALYDQREAEIKESGIKITQKNINVPVNLRYNIGLGDLAGIYFAAGPQIGFNIGNKTFSSAIGNMALKKSNMSVNLGAGVRLFDYLEIGAVYNIACGKTGDLNFTNIGKSDVKSNSWQISAACYF
ncbi:MAG: porin family protein [Prevotella sp.]|nr:porin family protein [Prevotella sp.]